MAVSCIWFGKTFEHAFNGLINFDEDVIKISLHTDGYTPDQDAHDFWDDIDNEVVGAGYVADGKTLANCSITYTGGTNVLKLDADDPVWGSSTITARYACIYVREAADADSPVILLIDFGENKISSGGNFTITLHADGACKVTVGA